MRFATCLTKMLMVTMTLNCSQKPEIGLFFHLELHRQHSLRECKQHPVIKIGIGPNHMTVKLGCEIFLTHYLMNGKFLRERDNSNTVHLALFSCPSEVCHCVHNYKLLPMVVCYLFII